MFREPTLKPSVPIVLRIGLFGVSLLAISSQAYASHSPSKAEKQGQEVQRGPESSLPDDGTLMLKYESVFADYQRVNSAERGSWAAANDKVGRKGGWQAYAQESYRTNKARREAAEKRRMDAARGKAAEPGAKE